MALKKFRPVTPTLRHTVSADYSDITRRKPVKALTERLYKTGGRDNYGHVSMRWISGGHKQRYRLIDFRREKDGAKRRDQLVKFVQIRSLMADVFPPDQSEEERQVAAEVLRTRIEGLTADATDPSTTATAAGVIPGIRSA